VLTEETQQGALFLDVIGRQYPGVLYRYHQEHQEWVERLATATEAHVAKKAADPPPSETKPMHQDDRRR
jgi:hypothetical protein